MKKCPENPSLIKSDKTSVIPEKKGNNSNKSEQEKKTQIQLNNFGFEKMPSDRINEYILNLDFRKLFESIYYNPHHPDNHIIRIKNFNRQQMEVYEDNKWCIYTFKSGFYKIVMHLISIFQRYKHLQDISTLERYQKEINIIMKMSRKYCDIKAELLCCIEENKKMVCRV